MPDYMSNPLFWLVLGLAFFPVTRIVIALIERVVLAWGIIAYSLGKRLKVTLLG